MSIHEGFLALAATSIDFELDEYDRAELDRHLAGCDACRRTVAAFRDDAAAIASEPGPTLAPGRSAAILAAALRPQKSSPPLRLLAVAALLAIVGAGVGFAGMQYLRSDAPDLAVVPSPSPSSTPGLPSPTPVQPTASPEATSSPIATTPPDDGTSPQAPSGPLVRGSAREIGHQIQMAPASDGNLYVSIPGRDGVVLAVLDGSGRPRTGWPIKIPKATSCGEPMVADDGSVRIICDGSDLPKFDNDPSDVRAFAYDASGRSMTGWPVQLRPAIGRVIGDDLALLTLTYGSDTFEVGTVSHVASMRTIGADGSIRTGAQVEMVETCCAEKWAIGPDGVAYGIVFHRAGDDSLTSSELVAVGTAGILAGFPVAIAGVASTPAFDAAGRIHVTVAAVSEDSPYHGPARTLVFDAQGRAVAGGSADLGLVASDTCVGIEGSCEGPGAPLVGADGTTFVIDTGFKDTIAARVMPSGEMAGRWPYRSDAPYQLKGYCAPGEVCEWSLLAMPAISSDNVLYLVHGAESESIGGNLVAVGSNGRVVAGWPVGLKRAGSAFWSVVVGPDRTVYALAIEPEPGDTSSATILGIAPDSTIRYTTTIVDP